MKEKIQINKSFIKIIMGVVFLLVLFNFYLWFLTESKIRLVFATINMLGTRDWIYCIENSETDIERQKCYEMFKPFPSPLLDH